MPSIWLSIIYFFIKNKFIKKILIKIIFILLILPSLPIVSTTLEKLFHNGLYKISVQEKKPAYILVLGAGADATGKFPTTESLKRAELGIELSKKYSAPIIFSGGLAADILPNFFDLSETKYIKEVKSTNTFDSVKNLKGIVKSSEDLVLLVTSPIHYKRSIILLRHNNFNVRIPNNYDTTFKNNYSFIPTSASVSRFNNMMYEIIAIIWYYCSSKI